MKWLIFVKFLPGGSLAPEEFFAHINAQSSWIEDQRITMLGAASGERTTDRELPRAAMCIAEYDSIEQSAVALSIMPGAGISNVEVIPLSEETEPVHGGQVSLTW